MGNDLFQRYLNHIKVAIIPLDRSAQYSVLGTSDAVEGRSHSSYRCAIRRSRFVTAWSLIFKLSTENLKLGTAELKNNTTSERTEVLVTGL